MMSNGADMLQAYRNSDPVSALEEYDCVNIDPTRELTNINASNPFYFLGACTGVEGDPNGQLYSYSEGHNVAWYNSFTDSITANMYQTGYQGTVQPPSAQHYQGYEGYAGSANFEWSFISKAHKFSPTDVGFALDTQDPIRSIEMEMYDANNIYDCNDERFGILEYTASIQFVNSNDELLILDKVFTGEKQQN